MVVEAAQANWLFERLPGTLPNWVVDTLTPEQKEAINQVIKDPSWKGTRSRIIVSHSVATRKTLAPVRLTQVKAPPSAPPYCRAPSTPKQKAGHVWNGNPFSDPSHRRCLGTYGAHFVGRPSETKKGLKGEGKRRVFTNC